MFALADVTMGLLAIANLIAVALLFKVGLRLMRDYDSQIRAGIESSPCSSEELRRSGPRSGRGRPMPLPRRTPPRGADRDATGRSPAAPLTCDGGWPAHPPDFPTTCADQRGARVNPSIQRLLVLHRRHHRHAAKRRRADAGIRLRSPHARTAGARGRAAAGLDLRRAAAAAGQRQHASTPLAADGRAHPQRGDGGGCDAVLLLHGTDTAYSAAALSFLLLDLPVPVLLTGAMLPAGSEGSDAWPNLFGAMRALQAGRVSGVQLYFNGALLHGARVSKLRSDALMPSPKRRASAWRTPPPSDRRPCCPGARHRSWCCRCIPASARHRSVRWWPAAPARCCWNATAAAPGRRTTPSSSRRCARHTAGAWCWRRSASARAAMWFRRLCRRQRAA